MLNARKHCRNPGREWHKILKQLRDIKDSLKVTNGLSGLETEIQMFTDPFCKKKKES
jgi:hypothetical protein